MTSWKVFTTLVFLLLNRETPLQGKSPEEFQGKKLDSYNRDKIKL